MNTEHRLKKQRAEQGYASGLEREGGEHLTTYLTWFYWIKWVNAIGMQFIATSKLKLNETQIKQDKSNET